MARLSGDDLVTMDRLGSAGAVADEVKRSGRPDAQRSERPGRDAFRCKLCGGTLHRRAHVLGAPPRTFRAASCADCGLFQVLYDWSAAPPPRATSDLDDASEDWAGEREMAAHWDKARAFAAMLQKERPLFGATVLDVGCGHGHFLRECAQRGASRVVGMEFRADSIAYARERCHVSDVRSAPLEDRQVWRDGEFDLVCSFDVAEHVHDLGSFLAHSLRVLRPGGMMFHATPGSDSITHRVGRAASRLGARGIASTLCNVEYVSALTGGPHVHLMGKRQVAWFARRHGLKQEVRYVSSYTYSDWHFARSVPQLRWLPRPIAARVFKLARGIVRNKMVFWARRR